MSRAPSTSAMTLAASVLPTPASPSMNSGFSSFKARKIDVARARSPMYLRSRSRCSTSSMVAMAAGELAVTRKGYEQSVGPILIAACAEISRSPPYRRLRAGGGPERNTGPPIRPLLGLFDRSLGQDPRQVLLVFRACSEVTGRVQTVGRVLRSLLRLGTVVQGLLDRMGANRVRAHCVHPDAPAAVHLLGRRADDRPVEKPAAELDVLVGAVRHGEEALDDDLIRLEGRRKDVLEEVLGGDRPLVGNDLGVQHQSDGRVVAGGVGVRDHASDRAHVADLVVAHLTRDLREDGQLLLHQRRVLNRHVTRQRADVELGPAFLDVVEFLDAVDVDERLGLRETQAHQGYQAVPARQHLGVVAVLVQQLGSLLDGGGAGVFECGRDHLCASFPWFEPACASWICFQTRSGLAGMSTCLMPNGDSASQTALMIAAELAIVPASPMPLTPSSLVGDGVMVRPSSNFGNSLALGTR